MSDSASNGNGGLESILQGIKPTAIALGTLAGAALGMYAAPGIVGATTLGAQQAASAVGGAIGGLGALLGSTALYNGADHIFKKFQTKWYQFLPGALAAITAYDVFSGYGLISAALAATISYVAGTGAGKFVYHKATQTADVLQNIYGGLKKLDLYKAVSEPYHALTKGVTGKITEFKKGFGTFMNDIKSYWNGSSAVPAPVR